MCVNKLGASSLFGLSCLSALAAFSSPAAAQSTGQWQRPEAIWAGTCHYCHDKGIGPQILGRNLDPELIKQFVRYGYRAMPAFPKSQISDKELAAIAIWVSKQRTIAPATGRVSTAPTGGVGK